MKMQLTGCIFAFLGVSLYLHSDALAYGIIENDMSPPTCHLSSSTIPVLKGETLITGSRIRILSF